MCEISVEGPISVISETIRNDKRNDIKFHIVSFLSAETIWNFTFSKNFLANLGHFLANFGHIWANFGHYLANFGNFLANFGHFSKRYLISNFFSTDNRNDMKFHIVLIIDAETIWFISQISHMPGLCTCIHEDIRSGKCASRAVSKYILQQRALIKYTLVALLVHSTYVCEEPGNLVLHRCT